MGLFHEIISWKLRMFVPTGAAGADDPGEAAGALSARPRRRSPSGRPRRCARMTPPNWRTVSRARPRRCADTISPMVAAKAAIGWSAMSHNTPGRSMFVRLKGPNSGKGAAGKWTDAATGEHGDLLDRHRDEPRARSTSATSLDEARSLPQHCHDPSRSQSLHDRPARSPTGSPESARRLFAMSQPISGTIVETYLRKRGITALHGTGGPAFPPALLLSARCRRADRDLAGDDRRRHRSRRQDHRRASHLARPIRRKQGADRHAEAGDGASPRQRRPFRCSWRCHGGRRRHRDHAVASMRHARHADGGGALGRTSRRHPVPGDAAPALHRPRRRSGR